MIIGVGIDVVDIDRFEESLLRTPAMRERLFTDGERLRPLASLAARFAAKESLAKALGAPHGMLWTDCWIENDDSGRPHFRLTGTVAARCVAVGCRTIHVSLSHDAGIASAMVILED